MANGRQVRDQRSPPALLYQLCPPPIRLDDTASLPADLYLDEEQLKRHREYVPVRFTEYHPGHKTEGFCYNLLLKHVPFRDETSLLACGTYMAGCIRHGLVRDLAHIEQLADEYNTRSMNSGRDTTATLHQMIQVYERASSAAQAGDLLGSPNAADDPDLHLDPGAEEEERKAAATEFDNDLKDAPSPEQQAHVDLLLANPTGVHAISGAGGCGKTYITKFLTRGLRRAVKKVQLSATTGAAARKLSVHARTVHSLLNLPVGNAQRIPYLSDDVYSMLMDTDVVVRGVYGLGLAYTGVQCNIRIALTNISIRITLIISMMMFTMMITIISTTGMSSIHP